MKSFQKAFALIEKRKEHFEKHNNNVKLPMLT